MCSIARFNNVKTWSNCDAGVGSRCVGYFGTCYGIYCNILSIWIVDNDVAIHCVCTDIGSLYCAHAGVFAKLDSLDTKVEWGIDLNAEHERYICEEVVGGPVFLTDYPKEIKAFYMRLNDDNKTVAACDLLVPGIGELVGGSQREERYDVLEKLMDEKGMNKETLQWYMDLRRFGGCKHAGFGLGFDRFLMYLTGMANIRDVEPFPRTPRNLKF